MIGRGASGCRSTRDRFCGLMGDAVYEGFEGGGRGCQSTSMSCQGREGEGGSYGICGLVGVDRSVTTDTGGRWSNGVWGSC